MNELTWNKTSQVHFAIVLYEREFFPPYDTIARKMWATYIAEQVKLKE